jgi:hypothetical protein
MALMVAIAAHTSFEVKMPRTERMPAELSSFGPGESSWFGGDFSQLVFQIVCTTALVRKRAS